MQKSYFILKNRYFDSIVLMEVSAKLAKVDGVIDASVMMGTDGSQGILLDTGFLDEKITDINAGDMLCCLKSEGDVTEVARAALDELLQDTSVVAEDTGDYEPRSLEGACDRLPGANLLILSIPGEHVRWEVLKAIKNNMNVMLFSDNVDVETERELKTLADQKGLIVMGPDCGTAIISGTALCFANVMKQGSIGIVGASGTGIQEVTSVIDLLGSGITHAIGTGGRDLKKEIGGISMLRGIEMLDADPETKVICLISKPPDAAITEKILARVKQSAKPFVIIFLGAQLDSSANVHGVKTLEEAAFKAVELATGAVPSFSEGMTEEETTALASRWKTKLAAQTINFRGLFAGGTLCTEVKLILKNAGIPLVLEPAEGADLRHGIALGEGNIILDLGEDIFTVGRPHPMIDSTLRAEYIKSAGKDKNVKILALDFVGGYGSNDDPAGSLAEAIVAAKRDDLLVVASFCGTEGDPQKRSEQIAKLQELGVQVFPTAARAAEFVVKVMK